MVDVTSLTLVAHSAPSLARVSHMQTTAAVSAPQKARQQRLALADRPTDRRPVVIRVVSYQLLVPLVLGPSDVAIVMVGDQHFPLAPRESQTPDYPFATVLEVGTTARAAERIRAGVDRVG